MKVTYWSDYACPYCYIGETRLRKAIEALGDVEHVLAGSEFRDEVLADEREAAQRGVRGVPYFDFDGRIVIPGAYPARRLEEAMRDILDDSCGAGAACGLEGCE